MRPFEIVGPQSYSPVFCQEARLIFGFRPILLSSGNSNPSRKADISVRLSRLQVIRLSQIGTALGNDDI